MPFALAIIAIALMTTAVKGTTSTFFGLVRSDFTGSGNYLYWVLSLLIIGSVGYVKRLQGVSDAFIGLVLLVFFIANKGFFASFMSQIAQTGNCPTAAASSTLPTTRQALDAAAKEAPGAGFGFTAPTPAPGQIVPTPFAFGPI